MATVGGALHSYFRTEDPRDLGSSLNVGVTVSSSKGKRLIYAGILIQTMSRDPGERKAIPRDWGEMR